MTIFLSGGSKNGKSTLGERAARALAGEGPLWYVATMIPHDEEDRAQIRRHRQDREGCGFQTVEQGWDLSSCLAGRCGTFLVDSVTALLANEMFPPPGVRGSAAFCRRGRACSFCLRLYLFRRRPLRWVHRGLPQGAGRYRKSPGGLLRYRGGDLRWQLYSV